MKKDNISSMVAVISSVLSLCLLGYTMFSTISRSNDPQVNMQSDVANLKVSVKQLQDHVITQDRHIIEQDRKTDAIIIKLDYLVEHFRNVTEVTLRKDKYNKP